MSYQDRYAEVPLYLYPSKIILYLSLRFTWKEVALKRGTTRLNFCVFFVAEKTKIRRGSPLRRRHQHHHHYPRRLHGGVGGRGDGESDRRVTWGILGRSCQG